MAGASVNASPECYEPVRNAVHFCPTQRDATQRNATRGDATQRRGVALRVAGGVMAILATIDDSAVQTAYPRLRGLHPSPSLIPDLTEN